MPTTSAIVRSLMIAAVTVALNLPTGASAAAPAIPLTHIQLEALKAEQGRQIARCNASWDVETRMTRQQFLAACTRVLGPHR